MNTRYQLHGHIMIWCLHTKFSNYFFAIKKPNMLVYNSSLDAILHNLMNLMIILKNSNSTNSSPKLQWLKIPQTTNYNLWNKSLVNTFSIVLSLNIINYIIITKNSLTTNKFQYLENFSPINLGISKIKWTILLFCFFTNKVSIN